MGWCMKVDCTFEFTKNNPPLSVNLLGISLGFPRSCKRREMTDVDYVWPHCMALAWKNLSEYQLCLLLLPDWWLSALCFLMQYSGSCSLIREQTTFIWHFVTLVRKVANPRSWLNKWYLNWEFKNEKDLDAHLVVEEETTLPAFP